MCREAGREHDLIVGPTSNRNDTSYKPSFLTDQELKHLVLEVLRSHHLFRSFRTIDHFYVSDHCIMAGDT